MSEPINNRYKKWEGIPGDPVVNMCLMLAGIGLIITLALEYLVYE